MLLTYSIANDEITLGFIEGGALIARACASTDIRRTADEYACIFRSLIELRGIDTGSFEGAIGASVVPPLTETVRSALEKILALRPHILGAGVKTGVNILTDDPSQLGGDLVAAAAGALTKYAPPLILIDFGTATTFSVLDKSGAFIGCAIAPGLALSGQALSNGTSLLPNFANSVPKKCIGTSTLESLQSGCVLGCASMVSGMISRIEAELTYDATVIASGKDANVISSLCGREMLLDDDLLLLGLCAIYERNKRKKK